MDQKNLPLDGDRETENDFEDEEERDMPSGLPSDAISIRGRRPRVSKLIPSNRNGPIDRKMNFVGVIEITDIYGR